MPLTLNGKLVKYTDFLDVGDVIIMAAFVYAIRLTDVEGDGTLIEDVNAFDWDFVDLTLIGRCLNDDESFAALNNKSLVGKYNLIVFLMILFWL